VILGREVTVSQPLASSGRLPKPSLLRAGFSRASERRSYRTVTAEERVLERRLKRLCTRPANAKARAQLRLRRAINFDVDLARSLQPIAHRRRGEGGRVAIATEMTKHNALDPARQQLFDHAR